MYSVKKERERERGKDVLRKELEGNVFRRRELEGNVLRKERESVCSRKMYSVEFSRKMYSVERESWRETYSVGESRRKMYSVETFRGNCTP